MSGSIHCNHGPCAACDRVRDERDKWFVAFERDVKARVAVVARLREALARLEAADAKEVSRG